MAVLELDGPESKQSLAKLNNFDKDSKKAVRLAFYDISKQLVRYSKEKMLEKPKTGKTYLVKLPGINTRIKHTASSPDEFPADLTRNLIRNHAAIHTDSRLRFGITDRAPYGKPLEIGNDRIKAREFLKRTLDENNRDIVTTVEEYLNRELGGL